jgi:hypothetical protein
LEEKLEAFRCSSTPEKFKMNGLLNFRKRQATSTFIRFTNFGMLLARSKKIKEEKMSPWKLEKLKSNQLIENMSVPVVISKS